MTSGKQGSSPIPKDLAARVRRLEQLGVPMDACAVRALAQPLLIVQRDRYIPGRAFAMQNGSTGIVVEVLAYCAVPLLVIEHFQVLLPWTTVEEWAPRRTEGRWREPVYGLDRSDLKFGASQVLNDYLLQPLRRGACRVGVLLGSGTGSIPSTYRDGIAVTGELTFTDIFGTEMITPLSFTVENTGQTRASVLTSVPRQQLFAPEMSEQHDDDDDVTRASDDHSLDVRGTDGFVITPAKYEEILLTAHHGNWYTAGKTRMPVEQRCRSPSYNRDSQQQELNNFKNYVSKPVRYSDSPVCPRMKSKDSS